MVGSSKVLTVSYGTFSCTLEGFDESFDTMTAIAEYFRDLAADDRYFGAEPPTPDAEMLARIAEREISRRVEARMSDGSVYLTAGSATMPNAAASAATVSPKAPTNPPAAFAAAPLAAMPPVNNEAEGPADVQEAPTAEVMPEVARRPAPASSESVAAKLQRIRSVVGKNAAAPAEFIEDLTPSANAFEAPQEASDDGEVTFNEVDTIDLDALAAATDETPAEPEITVEAEPAVEALVEETPVEQPIEPETDELEQLTVAEVEHVAEPEVEAEVDVAIADEVEAETAQVAPTPAEPEQDDEALLAKLTFGEEEASSETPFEEAPAEVEATETEALAALSQDDAEVAEAETGSDSSERAELRSARNRVRVVRMKRAEFEAAAKVASTEASDSIFADTDADEIDDAPLTNLADLDGLDEINANEESLSAEEDADLMRELSNIEDEYSAPEAADVAEDVADEDAEDSDLRINRRALLESTPDQDDAAMSRILSRTDAKLKEPESNRRREAFTHLKAAVAATEAARQLGETEESDEVRENPFRKVLDQVVRPRRATTSDDADQAERLRPAPLKLVASQRVDVEPSNETVMPARPVLPRRVNAASSAALKAEAPAEESGFAQYAESVGAIEIGELLEAAAAYSLYVEGVEDFSRPQLMRRAMEVENFEREDGLRSFGTLLREGRIKKVRNGRFQVTEDTPFRLKA